MSRRSSFMRLAGRGGSARPLALNVRNPREFRGDLAAMLGAAHLASGAFQNCSASLARQVGAAIEAILDATEQQTRAVVDLKDGALHGEAFSTMMAMAAAISDRGQGHQKGRELEVDFPSPIRSRPFCEFPHANMQAAWRWLCLSDRCRDSQEHRRATPVESRKAGTIVCRSRASGDVHQPSLNEIVEAIAKALSASCPEQYGGLEPPVSDSDPGRGSANGQEFHLAFVSGAPGGGASSGGDG